MNFTCNDSWSVRNRSLPNGNDSEANNDSLLCLDSIQSRLDAVNHYDAFFSVAFGSSIFIVIVSFITVVANSCLLLAFFVDPLKMFRNPTTYFLIGLAIADLLSALVQEPIYAACFMLLYFQSPSAKKCPPFMAFGKQFVSTTMTVSFIIVFSFTLTQYIVVSSPLKYARLVTKKKVLIAVATIYVYSSVLWWCLPLMGLSLQHVEMFDLIVHNYVLVVSTVVLYILLHRLMKKKMAAGNSLQGQATSREDSRHTQVQRNFVRVNFMLLAVLTICAMPPAIMWTIVISLGQTLNLSVNLLIGQLMSDNLFYLKSLLNPFIYAWRLMKYREAFYKSFYRKKTGKYSGETKSATGTRSRGELVEVSSFTSNAVSFPSSQSVITLLSFKELEK